jgi:PAS domain S-box-containing protein
VNAIEIPYFFTYRDRILIKCVWKYGFLSTIFSHRITKVKESFNRIKVAPLKSTDVTLVYMPLSILLIQDNDTSEICPQSTPPESEWANWQVTHVRRLSDGITHLKQHRFDVILSDLKLPDAQGSDIISHLQAIAPVPIIVLTDVDSESLEVEALRRGAQDYLVKAQLHANSLKRAIRYAIERSRTQQVMHQQVAAMASCQEGIAILNRHEEHIYVNQAYVNIFGYSKPTDLLGKTWKVLYGDAELQRLIRDVVPVLYQQGSWRGETVSQRQDGSNFYLEVSLTLLNNGGLVCAVSDITERKQSERLLQESIDRFRNCFELPLIGVAITAPDKKWIEVNDTTCKMLGYSRQELMQMTWAEVTHPEDLPLDVAYFEQILSGQIDQYAMDKRYIRKDGKIIYAHFGIGSVRAADGSLEYVVALMQDITERKQSEEKFRQLAENIQEVFFLETLDGQQLFYISPTYEKVWGRSCQSLYENPTSWLEVVHPDDLDRVRAAVDRQIQTYESFDEEYRIIRPDGSIRWIWTRDNVFFNDIRNVYCRTGFAQDITNRKQAEEEVLRALAREKELNELKSNFVSLVSHEFRTPLATILSSTELLKKYGHQWAEERKQIQFERIIAGVDRMTQLLNDVLVISRVESAKPQFNPTQLNLFKYCQDLIQEIGSNFNLKHRITFTALEHEQTALIDPQLLRHILGNLISNAVKYSSTDSAIQVELICQEQAMLLHVQDWGIGIPETDLDKVFDSFHRGGNVGTIQGTGLGLAIVKQCVDLHGGTIQVQSKVGKGTRFTVTLPLHTDSQV